MERNAAKIFGLYHLANPNTSRTTALEEVNVSVHLVGRIMASLVLSLVCSCAPSPTQLRQQLEQSPDILYSMIQKNPEKFIEVVTAATQTARASEKAKLLEEQIKNPKQPDMSTGRAFSGQPDAPVTIVEYTDLQCPFCKRGHATTEELLRDYPGKIRIVVKHLPLRIHPLAMPAARMYEAIAIQDADKALMFKGAVFTSQDQLNAKGPEFIDAMARTVGANLRKARADAASSKVNDRIQADMAEAARFGFTGTPAYLVNGVALNGARPIEDFRRVIDRILADK